MNLKKIIFLLFQTKLPQVSASPKHYVRTNHLWLDC